MNNETKELLKRTLAMTDDKLLLKFAKSYAAKDQVFAEAIIEKFLPEGPQPGRPDTPRESQKAGIQGRNQPIRQITA